MQMYLNWKNNAVATGCTKAAIDSTLGLACEVFPRTGSRLLES